METATTKATWLGPRPSAQEAPWPPSAPSSPPPQTHRTPSPEPYRWGSGPRMRPRSIRLQDTDTDTEARLVLAIDYGTTYTGIAYAQTTGREIDLENIQVVQSWPGATEVKVPSQISYSHSKHYMEQFGYNIDENSDVLSNTKLELHDNWSRRHELKTFTKVLHGLVSTQLNDASTIKGLIPRHLAKSAEEIVQDYLEHIAGVTYDDIVNTLGRFVPEQIPIDVIITHPAKWPDEALNKTYRAASAAFGDRFPTMRNISFVSEPEACAHYTLRAAQKADHARFRKGDCFIVVDAGGGTVDLASFQITDIDVGKNKFEMKEVGRNTGLPCGSTHVDTGFVRNLKSRLDPADSEKLAGNGPFGDGGHFLLTRDGMHVFKEFLPVKHGFKGTDTGMVEVISLPRDMNIQDRADRGIVDGNLQLTNEDIRDMFRFSVESTLTLIGGRINSLTNGTPRYRVKSIFLSGGFARSEYLFSRVSDFGKQQRIAVEKGKDCWCAVAKGAVLKGLGLLTNKPPVITRSPCFYGVKTRQHYSGWRNTGDNIEVDAQGVKWATDQIKWFVHKSDAIQPGKDRFEPFDCHFPDVVFVASSQDDAPSKFHQLDKNKAKIVTIRCNMAQVPASQRSKEGTGANRYTKCSVQVGVRINTTSVTITVTSGGVPIAQPETMVLEEVQ